MCPQTDSGGWAGQKQAAELVMRRLLQAAELYASWKAREQTPQLDLGRAGGWGAACTPEDGNTVMLERLGMTEHVGGGGKAAAAQGGCPPVDL